MLFGAFVINIEISTNRLTPYLSEDRDSSYYQFQSPRNQLTINQMKSIPYETLKFIIRYAQVCICPDLAFITGLLGRFQSNPGMKHRKATKKALNYMQRTKHDMLTYKTTDNHGVIDYSDSLCKMCWLLKVPMLCLHTCKWSYVVKKLQTNNYYFFHDACWVFSILRCRRASHVI
jgi:hypothetical protein